MRDVFDPGGEELADLRGDPSRVVEIQEKIREMLKTSSGQRKLGLKRDILEHGAWALPGLINATYVYIKELEDKNAQSTMTELMCKLAEGNRAAMDLLFTNGILENPFGVPRRIAQKALAQLSWAPDHDQAQQLQREIHRYQQLQDTQTIVALYAALFLRHDPQDLEVGLGTCRTWVEQARESAGAFLRTLIDGYPAQARQVLTTAFLAVGTKYNDENLAEALLKPLRPIPCDWLGGDILLDLSVDVLENIPSSRHTAVEYLWRYAAKDMRFQNDQYWQAMLKGFQSRSQQRFSDQVSDGVQKSVYRYWFRAVAEVGQLDYVLEQVYSDSERWRDGATVQLFFNERAKLARQALEDLKVKRPTQYEKAQAEYNAIRPISKIPGKVDQGRPPAIPTG